MEENLLFFVIIIMIKRKNKKNTLVLEVKVVQIIFYRIKYVVLPIQYGLPRNDTSLIFFFKAAFEFCFNFFLQIFYG